MQGQPMPLVPPLQGVRGDVPAYEIPDGFLWRAQNVVPRYGRLTTRPGLGPVASTGPGGRVSGGAFFKTVNNVDRVVAANLTKWFRQNATVWTDISGAVTFTGVADDPTRFAAFQQAAVNYVIGVNNHDGLYSWDGIAASITALGGGPPSTARDITTVGNFVMVVNTLEAAVRQSVRVRWSAFNNKDSWPANNFADLVALNAGDNGIAVRALGRLSVAVYLDKSIWVGDAQSGVNAFNFELRSHVEGPCSPAAVIPYGELHFYFGRDSRIYRFDGLSAVPVSPALDYFLQTSGLSTQFRAVNRARVWGEFNAFDRNIWWYYPGPNNADPTLAVSYNVDDGSCHLHMYPVALTAGWAGDEVATLAWSDLTGTWNAIGPGTYNTWDDFAGTLQNTMFIGSSAGQVYRQRYGLTDDGTPITMTWEYPLKAWLGLENSQHIDGVEAFFEQVAGGPLVTVQIGVSDAMSEFPDPTYTTIGQHDPSLATRQKLTQNVKDLNGRFASIRFSATTSTPLKYVGGLFYAWPEAVS